MLWAFSIWLESVAILPQLFMLQRTGEAETITTHYLAALGAYRALYIPNWIWRYFTEAGHFDVIAVLAGIVQTVLYADFFWIYYTKYVIESNLSVPLRTDWLLQGVTRQEVQPPSIGYQRRSCLECGSSTSTTTSSRTNTGDQGRYGLLHGMLRQHDLPEPGVRISSLLQQLRKEARLQSVCTSKTWLLFTLHSRRR